MARLGALLFGLSVVAACAGEKKEATTPDKARPADAQHPETNDSGGPAGQAGQAGGPDAAGGATQPGGDVSAGEPGSPAVTMPSYDPDPAQAKAQVEQHLQIARAALASATPDGDAALREARLALQIDAASIDAAAMVAFAYYHKHLYDTAELVLDDLFKREAAKQNANVYYVYGLVYDHTSRPEQAVMSYKKAVELNPNHTSALIDLGVHQLENTQYAEALQTFDRLVNQFGRTDAVTLTSLGSAYRGHAADYPAGSPEHDDNVRKAEAAYKRALHANPGYGPAYYNLGLLYLDNDPFPGLPDNLLRLNTAKSYFEQYKNMANLDIKLYDDRMKDVTKAIKRAEKQQKKAKGSPAAAPAAKARGGGKPR
ncbi:MAG TPA: tetratricopeptide repeat protein [Kofleriaceae bacterium]|nr:tetratricopeptide repeat protein [Kofleriaceae bacterium]